MAIQPITGTDTVAYIQDTAGNKASANIVIPVNADGTAMGGGSATSPSIAGLEYNSTPPTLTNGQTDALQGDSRGNLRASLVDANGTFAANIRLGFSDNSSNTGNGLLTQAYSNVFNGTTWDRARGDTTGAYVVQKGTATVANGQISVATTNTQIVAARTGRGRVTITNLGTTDVFIGVTGVTTTNGQLLAGTKGASITLHTSAAIFGIVGTGTQSVSYIEEY